MEARQQSGPLDPFTSCDHLLTELTGLAADCFPSRKNPPRPQRASLDVLQKAFKGHWEPTLCPAAF